MIYFPRAGRNMLSAVGEKKSEHKKEKKRVNWGAMYLNQLESEGRQGKGRERES